MSTITQVKQKMRRRNPCSSSIIHISLKQLFLFASIAGMFFYSCLYVQPQQHRLVEIFRFNNRPTTLTLTMTMTTVVEGENEEEEDYDESSSIPIVDELSSPPIINVTVEERIVWFKQKLNESKLLKSTPRTRKFHDKITAFLGQGNTTSNSNNNSNNNATCNVLIFMTWISRVKLFGKRELFSLETVLKSHPRGCVVILSRIMDSKAGRTMLEPLVTRGYRVLPVAIDFHLLFNNTPAQGWLERLEAGLIDPGEIPITQNLSNLLRLVALYKYGGVYFDTDMVIIKDVSGLKNSIGIQTMVEKPRGPTTLNNAVLIFDKGHPMLWKFMEEFASNFDGKVWGVNGPYLVTRVVHRHVNDTKIKPKALPHMAFYPVDWTLIYKYFRSPDSAEGVADTKWVQYQMNQISSKSYGIHLWNKISRSLSIEKGSIIGKLISENCIICQDVYNS